VTSRRSFWTGLGVLGAVGFLLLVFAGSALETLRSPVPRWWWIGLWRTYLGCLVGGGALAILLAPAPGRDRELWLLPAARPRAFVSDLAGLVAGLLPILATFVLLWLLAIRAGAPLTGAAIGWAHGLVFVQLLALGSWRAVAFWWQGRRGAIGVGLAFVGLALASFLDPLWMWWPETVAVPAAILSSPLLSVHAAAGEDVLRSSFWYGATHLGSWRFDYPAPPWTLVPPVVTMLVAWLLVRGRALRWAAPGPATLEVP